jgi:hypothetical protein
VNWSNIPNDRCATCGHACRENEAALRHLAYYGFAEPMTPEQRAWCIDEADRAGEGTYRREDLEKLSDQELAKTVLQAWWDYVRSNCL